MRLALAAVAASALAAVACGGVESEPNLAKAVENTEATGSFALEMTTRFSDAGDEFEWSCDGTVDSIRRRSRLVCPGPEGKVETITVDNTTYHRDTSPGGKWWKLPAGDDLAVPEEYSPEKILGLLRTSSRKTQRVDEEIVRGEPTVRYSLTVDCEQAELHQCTGETAVVDVWIDDDGVVRRVAFDETRADTMSIEFFDFGKPVEVEAPPADQIEPWPDLQALACMPGRAGPIRVDRATQALQRAGFDVGPDDSACGGGIATGLSNLPADFDPTDLLSQDGYLSCVVHTGENGIWFILRQDFGPGAPDPVERSFENVDCTLWVEGPQADERIAALDAALDELKRELHP